MILIGKKVLLESRTTPDMNVKNRRIYLTVNSYNLKNNLSWYLLIYH